MAARRLLFGYLFPVLLMSGFPGTLWAGEPPFPVVSLDTTELRVSLHSAHPMATTREMERADWQRRVSGSLRRAWTAYGQTRADWPDAGGLHPRQVRNGQVRVEIRYQAAQRSTVHHQLQALGLEIVRDIESGAWLDAWLPLAVLPEAAELETVYRIDPARMVQPLGGDTTTEGLAASNAGPWHDANFDGDGLTIAIIDIYADTEGEIDDLQASGDWPPDSRLTRKPMHDCGTPTAFGACNNNHGNAVVEITHDLAPGAHYLAYDTAFISEWIEAIDDAVSEGADIISASLGAPLDGKGDGSALPGSVAEAVEAARTNGVVYINAAGNSREEHWGGLYNEAEPDPWVPSGYDNTHDWDADPTINFLGPEPGEVYCIPNGFPLRGDLQWNDWDEVDQDYDLALLRLDDDGITVFTVSDDTQDGSGGQRPIEQITAEANTEVGLDGCDEDQAAYGWQIWNQDASGDHNFRFFSPLPVVSPSLQFHVHGRSLGYPADSPAALTVAALNVEDDSHEFYSSEGPILSPGGGMPTGGEHPKPDVASFARVSTTTIAGFAGTSAAAPHVAGMAALLWQRHPGFDADEIVERLNAISVTGANDLGDPGHDFQHGWGRLRYQSEDALAVETQPGDTTAGEVVTPPVDIELLDEEGLRVLSGPTTALDIELGTDPSGGSASLSGTLQRSLNEGLAEFDDLSIDVAADGYTLAASNDNALSVQTESFNVLSPFDRLAFDQQPPTTVEAGEVFTVTVQVEDGDGNIDTGDDSTEITIDLANDPSSGDATLSGQLQRTVANGVAEFDDLNVDVAGAGYTLQATATDLQGDESESFDVVAASAHQLAFDQQPADVTAGEPFIIVVEVQDEFGNRVSNDNSTEATVAFETDPSEGAAVLGGTTTRTASNGLISFDDLHIEHAEQGYRLEATAPGLETGLGDFFDVVAASAYQLAFDQQPADIAVDAIIDPPVTVRIEDEFGNLVADDDSTDVALSFETDPSGGSATLGGSIVRSASAGIAAFDDLTVDEAGEGYTLNSAADGIDGDISAPFDVIVDEIFHDRFEEP